METERLEEKEEREDSNMKMLQSLTSKMPVRAAMTAMMPLDRKNTDADRVLL